MNLIPNWRRAWRMFSVQAQAAAIASIAGWQALPDDLRAMVPQSVAMGLAIALLVLGIVGRLIDQPKTREAN
jgi:hypothetical protein